VDTVYFRKETTVLSASDVTVIAYVHCTGQ